MLRRAHLGGQLCQQKQFDEHLLQFKQVSLVSNAKYSIVLNLCRLTYLITKLIQFYLSGNIATSETRKDETKSRNKHLST